MRKLSLSLLMDNVGDNISSKNRLYNEMTAIYWFWKNYPIDNLDYVGFNHYRRFFKREDFIDSYCRYDIIAMEPIRYALPYTLAEQYAIYHKIEDLDVLTSLLLSIDKKMGETFIIYMHRNKVMLAPCNMFIMKTSLFKRWCSFMFPVLSALEHSICGTSEFMSRDNYLKRALCFLTERLFGWWYSVLLMRGCKAKDIGIVEFSSFKPLHVDKRSDYSSRQS